MKQQAHLEISGFQIVKKLAPSRLVQVKSGFRFHYDLAVDDHIESLTRQFVTFVSDPNSNFAVNLMPTCSQLAFQSNYVNALQESKPESVVNLEKCPKNRVCNFNFRQRDHKGSMAGPQ